jgi:hypothetical protein
MNLPMICYREWHRDVTRIDCSFGVFGRSVKDTMRRVQGFSNP